MKIIHVHCGWRNEYRGDPRSYEYHWTSSENKAPKNSGPNGILTHDLWITVQRSTNWANRLTGSCWLQINHLIGEYINVIIRK